MINYVKFKSNTDFKLDELDKITRDSTKWGLCVKARYYYEFMEEWRGGDSYKETILLKVFIYDRKWGTTICSRMYKEEPRNLLLDFKELLQHTTRNDLNIGDGCAAEIMALIPSLIKVLEEKTNGLDILGKPTD